MTDSAQRSEGTRAWLIRGGRRGEREPHDLGEGLAIVGWSQLGDLGGFGTWEQLSAELQRAYPSASRNVIGNWTGQLWKFSKEIRPGDLVLMPLRNGDAVVIGRVTGPYRYLPEEPLGFRQVRPVNWVRRVPRSALKADLRASTGSLLTVCRLTRNDAASRIKHLAEDGIDPGLEGEEQAASVDDLLAKAIDRDAGNPVTLPTRKLLEHWGVERRTTPAIAKIKADLADAGLTTRPPFTEGGLEDEIALVPQGIEPDPEQPSETATGSDGHHEELTEAVAEPPPLQRHVGELVQAELKCIPRTASLTQAKSLMIDRQFSQLGVIDDEETRTFLGAISWESVGKAHIAKTEPTIDDATTQAVVVDHDALLLEQIEPIYAKSFIFVRSPDKKQVTGIVTASDLTRQFGLHARPFMLIEEVENRLRRAIGDTFETHELQEVVPKYQRSKVRTVEDLTFGNYPHLLKDEERWKRLGWNIDQDLCLRRLEDVRQIRNDLMHFSTDDISPEQYDQVHGLLGLLSAAAPLS